MHYMLCDKSHDNSGKSDSILRVFDEHRQEQSASSPSYEEGKLALYPAMYK